MRVLLCHNFYRKRTGEDIGFEKYRAGVIAGGHEAYSFVRHSAEIGCMNVGEKTLVPLRFLYSSATARELRSLIARVQPDVVLVRNVLPLMSASIYTVLRSSGLPLVQVLSNYLPICPNARLFTRGQLCERCCTGQFWNGLRFNCRSSLPQSALYVAQRYFARCLIKEEEAVTVYLAQSSFMRNLLVRYGYDDGKFEVLPNFAPTYEKVARERREGSRYVCYAGRLDPEKGVDLLIRAMPEIHRRTGVRLLIIGDGREGTRLRQLAARESSFLGHVEHRRALELLAGAEALVYTSKWYENCPNAVLEAMALGKPIVAADIGGLAELVRPDVNGVLFNPDCGDAIVDALVPILEVRSLRDKLGRGSLELARSEFSFESFVGRLGTVLERAVNRSSGY